MENVGQGAFQWTPKADALLYFHREPPGTVGLIKLSSKERTVLLRHPKLNLSLADARLAPDGRWIAFPVPFAPHRSRLAVARLSGKVIDDEHDWIYVTSETFNASQPDWSPNGQWLYYLSDQTGTLAVWAVRLSRDKKPEGVPKRYPYVFKCAPERQRNAAARHRSFRRERQARTGSSGIHRDALVGATLNHAIVKNQANDHARSRTTLLGQVHPAKQSGETGIGAKGVEHGIDRHTIGQPCGALLKGALEPVPGLFFFPESDVNQDEQIG